MEATRKFRKVPPRLRKRRRSDDNYYDPLLVSIGLYHYGSKELSVTDDNKKEIMELFIGGTDGSHDLFKMVLEKIGFFRSFYDIPENDKQYEDKQLASILFLDGCFVLFTLEVIQGTSRPLSSLWFLEPFQIVETVRDIFLLENQLPFPLLELLMSCKYDKESWERILNYSIRFCAFWKGYRSDWKVISLPSQDLHLLDVLRSYWQVTVDNNIVVPPYYNDPSHDSAAKMTAHLQSMPSVMELKAKGIKLMPSSTNNPTKNFTYVRFESFSFSGQLEIPAFILQQNLKPFLLNIIAYEISTIYYTEFHIPSVASYIHFLTSLIDNVDDVKELKAQGVIFNNLRSDEELVKMLQEIDVAPFFSKQFEQLKHSIHMHVDSKAKTWMAELCSTYFTSPWTAITLFASILVILLTFLQTVYTINPK